MTQGVPVAFFSYCREDSDFALRLARDLKAAGASVWLDQLDIVPGQLWDRAVEDALASCQRMLVTLTPAAVNSTNVMDEVSFALEEGKTVIPVVYKDCAVPFRLRRVQHVDFRQDYALGLGELLKTLSLRPEASAETPAQQPSDAILSEYRRRMLSAADSRDLRVVRYELEDFLRRFPAHPQALLLRDDIMRAERPAPLQHAPMHEPTRWGKLGALALLGGALYLVFRVIKHLLGF